MSAPRRSWTDAKGDLFCLDLSFIGWALLAVLTAGIGNLWLVPYMTVSRAAFYRSLPRSMGDQAPQRLAAEPRPAAGRRLVQPELNTSEKQPRSGTTFPPQGCFLYKDLQFPCFRLHSNHRSVSDNIFGKGENTICGEN